jgi:peroxisomal membrane protein 4
VGALLRLPKLASLTLALSDALSLSAGARNGLVYGAKVRAPHALIMTVLFGRGRWDSKLALLDLAGAESPSLYLPLSWKSRAKFVYRATKQHASNLARFVAIYKTALLLQKTLAGGKNRKADTFFAGLIGGWFVFGERNAVNEQVRF